METTIDGVRIFYLPVGDESNYPLIVLHGGPGLDHTEMHPWLDSLSDVFRLIYLDLRGHGRSQRVDPSTLTLSRYAADVTALARALGLQRYAVLGHSYGSFVTLVHAIEQGDASHYVVSGGSASMTKSMPEVRANLAAFEPETLREQVTLSWAREAAARTQSDVSELMRMQMPFHFSRADTEAYRQYLEADKDAIYTPEVIAYAAANEYDNELENELHRITRPVLFITGEHDRTTTPRASREMHAAVSGSDLVIVSDAGHMTFVEQPAIYFSAVRSFLQKHSPASNAQNQGQ
ncbi:MAG: proline iminopeptidase-family hydrolase [Chloroflexota bacterium]